MQTSLKTTMKNQAKKSLGVLLCYKSRSPDTDVLILLHIHKKVLCLKQCWKVTESWFRCTAVMNWLNAFKTFFIFSTFVLEMLWIFTCYLVMLIIPVIRIRTFSLTFELVSYHKLVCSNTPVIRFGNMEVNIKVQLNTAQRAGLA